MLSIDNTYSVDELREYGARVAKLLPGETVEWVVELKIDGVAVALMYEQGRLKYGATRGNGVVGDDITHNIRTVLGVPLKLHGSHVPSVLEVRGEVYMTNADLVRLNQQQAEKGDKLFANSRNVAAGTVACSTPRSAPSAACASSATASANPKACGPRRTWSSSRKSAATACPPRRWSNASTASTARSPTARR